MTDQTWAKDRVSLECHALTGTEVHWGLWGPRGTCVGARGKHPCPLSSACGGTALEPGTSSAFLWSGAETLTASPLPAPSGAILTSDRPLPPRWDPQGQRGGTD